MRAPVVLDGGEMRIYFKAWDGYSGCDQFQGVL